MALDGSVAWIWVNTQTPHLRSTVNTPDRLWLFHDGRMLREWHQPDRRGFRPNKKAGCLTAFAEIPFYVYPVACWHKFAFSFFTDIMQMLQMFGIFIASVGNSDFRHWFLTSVQWANQLNYLERLKWLKAVPSRRACLRGFPLLGWTCVLETVLLLCRGGPPSSSPDPSYSLKL